MFLNFSDLKHIILAIFLLINIIGFVVNILFGIVWFLYFLFRIKVLRKKVYYLKKQTDERCLGELNNAKVDHIKSIFLAAITIFEVLFHLSEAGAIAYQNVLKLPNDSCGTYFTEYLHDSQGFRAYFAFTITSIITFVSLIHILTSYLSHAYSEKRITNIMRRERVMFAWLFIQLVCVWCSIFYWPLFILTLPIMTVVALIGHLCLYWKYGRELYSVIRRRERDALFEDVHTHDKLLGMLKDYKIDAILYFVYICIFISVFTIQLLLAIVQTFYGDCKKILFHLKIHIMLGKGTPEKTTMFEVISVISLTIMTLPLLFIYIYIMCKLIMRMIKRRNGMYNPTNETHKTLRQPLIGNE